MNAPGQQQKQTRCVAIQTNRYVPDFECQLITGHSVHIDPRTKTRWGLGSVPHGMRRRGYKAYTNPKLRWQSALKNTIAKKEAKHA